MLRPAPVVFVACLAALPSLSCHKKSLPKGKLEGLAKTAAQTVPDNTAILFGVSWAGLKESQLYPKILDLMKKEKETAQRLDTLEEACGLDLARELDSIVVANDASMDEKHAVVFVKGNWDEAHANECLSAYWQKRFFHTLVPTKEGNLTVYALDGTNPKMYAWWPAPDTAVLAPKNLRDRTFLTDVVGAKTTVSQNQAFMDLLGRVDTTATYWLAMSATTSPAFENAFGQLIEGSDAKPLGLYVSVDLRDGLHAVVGLRFGAARDAKAIAKKGAQELEAARDDEDYKKYLDRVSITAIDRDVVFKAELDEDKLEELVGAFEEYLPTLGKYIKENLGG